MKALLIMESDEILSKYSNILENNGYDTIKYHWLLKALDNVEEIDPHLIVINTTDYPRHWKTFVQYVHANLTKIDPVIILIIDENFDNEEEKKAEFLGIRAIIKNLDDKADKDTFIKTIQLLNTLYHNKKIQVITSENNIPTISNEQTKSTNKIIVEPVVINKEIKQDDYELLFKNPKTKEVVTGKVISYKYPIVCFLPDKIEVFSNIRFGQIFDDCTIKHYSKVISVRAQVRGITDCIEFCLLK